MNQLFITGREGDITFVSRKNNGKVIWSWKPNKFCLSDVQFLRYMLWINCHIYKFKADLTGRDYLKWGINETT
jgi:hypothetical protein